jgi:hypothetical protein
MLDSTPADGRAVLKSVVEAVQKQPTLAVTLAVGPLVRQACIVWQAASSPWLVADELPWAAWLIRRKVEGLVAPPSAHQLSAPSPEPSSPPTVGAEWLAQAVQQLRTQQARAGWRGGRPPQPPDPARRPDAPISDATPARLAQAFPRTRRPPPLPRVVIRRPTEDLAYAMQTLWQKLPESAPVPLAAVLQVTSPPARAATFLALVHLWHRGAVDVSQAGAFAPVWIRRHPESRQGESACATF